ncbi:MAG: ribosome biogenesis GTPase YlqF [Cocleimonas sp.]|nr:ribosome biogenesis GTPase YlqF [Cocleimonas sp.]
MQIQWYPGHMHKASKELTQILPSIDLIIEVLDARIPFSSQNPMLATIRGDKPCIKILNKDDLADEEQTAQWQDYLDQQKGIKTLAVNMSHPERIKQLTTLCHKMVSGKKKSDEPLNAVIMGIPNVGKSTLINILVGRAIAKTGNEPAVTKGQQRIALKDHNILLFDTPGMLWGNIENRNSGYRLAATGAIKDTAIDIDDVGFFTADYLIKNYANSITERYQLTHAPTTELECLEALGKKRGCLRSGGVVDLVKASKILLTELRAGVLGRITLETPDMMEVEVRETAIIVAQKEKKKEARKTRRQKKKR